MDIALILTDNYPGRQFSVGDTYESIKALDGGGIPSRAELENAWPQVQYDREYKAVEKARQQAYITTSDPLFFEYQRGDVTEQQWRDAVQAVKDAHPYPEMPGAE